MLESESYCGEISTTDGYKSVLRQYCLDFVFGNGSVISQPACKQGAEVYRISRVVYCPPKKYDLLRCRTCHSQVCVTSLLMKTADVLALELKKRDAKSPVCTEALILVSLWITVAILINL